MIGHIQLKVCTSLSNSSIINSFYETNNSLTSSNIKQFLSLSSIYSPDNSN